MKAADYDRDDPTFVEDLKRSQVGVLRVAEWLRHNGRQVRVPPIRVRPEPGVMAEYSDAGDLFVHDGQVWRRLEVSVRGFDFTDRHDFPHATIIVGQPHTWDRAEDKPVAAIRLNQRMTHAAIVLGGTRDRWRQVKKWDNARRRERTFLECPIGLARFVPIWR